MAAPVHHSPSRLPFGPSTERSRLNTSVEGECIGDKWAQIYLAGPHEEKRSGIHMSVPEYGGNGYFLCLRFHDIERYWHDRYADVHKASSWPQQVEYLGGDPCVPTGF
jgi:hypothetical protein